MPTATRAQVAQKQAELSASVLCDGLEEAKADFDKKRQWKEPSTAEKIAIGKQLLAHTKSLAQLQASLKRQGLQHGAGTLYRWRDHVVNETRPRHRGGQHHLTSPRRAELKAEAETAIGARSAQSKRKFKGMLLAAMLASRKDRGMSSLGIKSLAKRTTNRYISTEYNTCKPQFSTQARWLACRDLRNAVTLYCLIKAVMFDRGSCKWILAHNCHNADFTTISFGYVSHSENKKVVVPKDMQRTREIEVVARKSATLPHSVKYASLQSANGATGDILLLYTTKLEWFPDCIRQRQTEIKKGLEFSAKVAAKIKTCLDKVTAEYQTLVPLPNLAHDRLLCLS